MVPNQKPESGRMSALIAQVPGYEEAEELEHMEPESWKLSLLNSSGAIALGVGAIT